MVAKVEMRALHLKADGAEVEINPAGRFFTLKEMQGYVDGFIEMVSLGEELTLVINEDGKCKALPLNNNATKLFRLYYPGDDFIVGDALVVKNVDLDD